VSDPRDPQLIDEQSAARPSRFATMLRVVFEFALLFGIAIMAKQVLASAATGSYPNPLWLPVIVLSLQHGLALGLTAAIIAVGVQYWSGLPPALLTEDMYAYIGRIAAEPVGWTCVALLIGYIRSRQIAQTRELEDELIEQTEHGRAVADLCAELRDRTEMLERQIAANAHASNIDVAEAVSDLHHATFDDFAGLLTRFIVLMTGASEFTVYVLQDGALKVAFQPSDEHRLADETVVPADDPLFAAIVDERRLVSAALPDDAALLGQRGALAGPLTDNHAPEHVIGMLAIGGSALEDHPDEIERRFQLTASELSRLAGRIKLVERWQAAANAASDELNREDNGQSNRRGATIANPEPEASSTPAKRRRRRGNRELTLQ
jgi:GAF domain-containing protein